MITILFVAIALMAACSRATPQPILPATPSEIAPLVSPSPANTTFPALPTRTLKPQQTATPAPSQTPGGPTATPDLNQYTLTGWSSDSPDGTWTAVGLVALPGANASVPDAFYRQLTFSKLSGDQKWVLIDGWTPYGLGYTTPSIERWSLDGRYAYIKDNATPDGCSLFGYSENFRRLNLSTGDLEAITPELTGVLSLSPDESNLAGIKSDQMVFHNLASGEELITPYQIEALNWQSGNPVWSPDSQSLLITAISNPCDPNALSSIIRFDLGSLQWATLIDQDPRQLSIAIWPTADQVILNDQAGKSWDLNPITGVLTEKP